MTYKERLQMYAQQHAARAQKETGDYACPYSGDELNIQAEVTCAAVAEGIILMYFSTIESYNELLRNGKPIALGVRERLINKGYVPKP